MNEGMRSIGGSGAVRIPSRAEQLDAIREASRAPSAHNAQPARWRFLPDGRVRLYEDRSRRIKIGDPTGRDARIGLGAALEGLDIALSCIGLGLTAPISATNEQSDPRDLVPIVESRLRPARVLDPLADTVLRRHTYRGIFASIDSEYAGRLDALLRRHGDISAVSDRARIGELATLNDDCALEFLAEPAYQKELYHWIRFRPSHPDWGRDGLTAECLALTPIQGSVAARLFRPRVFQFMRRLGLGSLLTSESAPVRSASVVAVMHVGPDVDDIAAGQRFYRFLLGLCDVGLAACPMSALVDSRRGRAQLRHWFSIPREQRLINAFRIGWLAEDRGPRSPRLPPEELLV